MHSTTPQKVTIIVHRGSWNFLNNSKMCKKCKTNLQNVSHQAEISAWNTKYMSVCIVSGESPGNLYCIVTQSVLLLAHHPLIPRPLCKRGVMSDITACCHHSSSPIGFLWKVGMNKKSWKADFIFFFGRGKSWAVGPIIQLIKKCLPKSK